MRDYLHSSMFDVNFSFATESVFVAISNETKDLPPPPDPEGNFLLLDGLDFLLLDGTNFELL